MLFLSLSFSVAPDRASASVAPTLDVSVLMPESLTDTVKRAHALDPTPDTATSDAGFSFAVERMLVSEVPPALRLTEVGPFYDARSATWVSLSFLTHREEALARDRIAFENRSSD